MRVGEGTALERPPSPGFAIEILEVGLSGSAGGAPRQPHLPVREQG